MNREPPQCKSIADEWAAVLLQVSYNEKKAVADRGWKEGGFLQVASEKGWRKAGVLPFPTLCVSLSKHSLKRCHSHPCNYLLPMQHYFLRYSNQQPAHLQLPLPSLVLLLLDLLLPVSTLYSKHSLKRCHSQAMFLA